MSPKKERGKQRKAAKSLAAASGVDNISKTVALLRKGVYNTTKLLGDGPLEESNGISYEQSGILSTVLKFLKRCEDDTFVKVLLDIGGGNLTTPQLWVRILVKAEVQEPSCRLQIAQSIGPLVKCMCNDSKRQFFKSNKHWRGIIQAFVALIHNMILHSVNNSDEIEGKKIIDTLLNYEGLLTSIVQWGFWDEDRPDITNELQINNCAKIIELGTATLNRLIKAADTQSEEDRERLEIIGTTPIISEEYDPECTTSFVVGLIRQVKIGGWTLDTSTSLRRLIANVSCVDKDVITELIDLGFATRDNKWSAHVAELLRYMILKRLNNNDGNFYTNDTKIAFAIRGGLFELSLHFIERFGLNESFDNKKDNVSSSFSSIKMILANIFWVVLHKKTAKAIRNKGCSIKQELTRLEQNGEITNNVNCKKLLDIARSILDSNGSYCCRCNKPLDRTDVKECNGCGCMAYCSRACQKEDWQNGHSISCCNAYTTELAGKFQGRFWPAKVPSDERAAAKLKELEINMNMIQLKLFLDNAVSILTKVKAMDIPIYDCVVLFDFRKSPHTVGVKKYTEYFTGGELEGFEGSRSKENITCDFVSYVYDGRLDEGQIPTLQTQRLLPHKWLADEQEKISKHRQRMKVLYLEEMCKQKRNKRLEQLSREILSFS